MTAWSTEHSDKAAALWVEGLSAALIAKRMNAELGLTLTRNAIIGRMHRLRMPKRVEPRAPGSVQAYPANRASAGKGRPRVPQAKHSKPLPPSAPTADLTGAKPWTERQHGECAFPVEQIDGVWWSCCAPAHAVRASAAAYCSFHRSVMYDGCPKPDARQQKRPGDWESDPVAAMAVAA